MTAIVWRTLEHAELATLLKGVAVEDSRAVGSSTVYSFRHEGRDVLAVALPDGQAVLVEPVAPARPKRRRVDPAAA